MSDANTPIGRVAKYVKEEIPAQVAKAVSEIEVPKGEDGSDGLGFNLKTWNPGIYREGVLVQHNIGQAYKALVDTNDEPGTSEAWERVGSAGFRWTGVKKADHSYCDGDLYIDGGTTFLFQGGKGYMLAQRGKNGKNGVDGIHGKAGADAPIMIDMTIVGKELVAVFSDGNMHSVEMPVLEEMADVQKQLTWLEEQLLAFENVKAPVKGYEGIWEEGKSYSKGDLVTFGKALYLCFEADNVSLSIDPDKWVKIAGGGSSGGTSVTPRPVVPYGSLWMRSASGTTFTTPATFTLVDIPAAAGKMSQFEPANQSRLVYTGSEKCVFQLNCMLSGQTTAASIVDATLFLNGTISDEFVVISTSTESAGALFSVSASIQLELQPQDYIEMYAQCSAGDLIVENYSITAHGLC